MEDNLKIPNHVGIILDGNGRWAKQRNLPRSKGHYYGFKNLEKISKYIFDRGVNVLSVFAFSTENFKRSKEEVDYLMSLFAKGFKTFNQKYKDKIKIVFSGRRDLLPTDVLKSMDEVSKNCKQDSDKIINICINYGGHSEIIDAVKKINIDVLNNKLNLDDLDEEVFNHYLYNDLPPIDLMIRTSGEVRISNFMLWQLSYAELYFPKVHFPDFDEREFDKAIIEYNKRDRRFGGINYGDKNS